MVEYKRAVEEFDPRSCSMEDIRLNGTGGGDGSGEKFYPLGLDDSALSAGVGVGIRFVNTGIYRSVSKAIGGVDIVYSMLLIGLHLLTLITGIPKSYGGRRANNSRAYSNSEFNSGELETNLEQQQRPADYPRRETIALIIWVGIFAVCILQILVAAALYTGTQKRDGRVCIRNCRIWCFTSVFLIIVIIFQLLGIFIMGNPEDHMVAVCVYFGELVFRTMAIIFIQSFIKELQSELCDVENGEHVLYYQLCPTPSPKHTSSSSATVAASTANRSNANNNAVSV